MARKARDIPLRVDTSHGPFAKCFDCLPTPRITQYEVRSAVMYFIENPAQSLQVSYPKHLWSVLPKNASVLDGIRRIQVNKVSGSDVIEQYLFEIPLEQVDVREESGAGLHLRPGRQVAGFGGSIWHIESTLRVSTIQSVETKTIEKNKTRCSVGGLQHYYLLRTQPVVTRSPKRKPN
jgi:hypothetical protein